MFLLHQGVAAFLFIPFSLITLLADENKAN